MQPIQIGDHTIGPDSPPLVIAEVGINHEGSLKKAIQMVDAAADAGSPIVKFQCHIPDKEMIETDMTPGDISTDRLWDIISRCTLNEDEERQVQDHCKARGILYLSTPFSREASDRLDDMAVPAFKIGSGECNNYPLIDHIAAKGKPIILSTGMNAMASIGRSVEIIKSHGAPLALLHCTSLYPTPYEKLRLGAMTELQNSYPDIPVGLSDHTLGIWTSLGAVALGAMVLEKHFTISRDWPGPDTPMSIEPNELKELVDGSRAVWQARGGSKDILGDEQPVIDFAYASVVTIAPISAGDVFSKDNLWVKRPGDGEILADEFDDLMGKKAVHDIPPDQQLSRADVG